MILSLQDLKVERNSSLKAMGCDIQTVVAFLAAVADHKCCPLCYFSYLRKFLDADSQHSLFCTAADCRCDWSESSSSGTSESADRTNADNNEMESETA